MRRVAFASAILTALLLLPASALAQTTCHRYIGPPGVGLSSNNGQTQGAPYRFREFWADVAANFPTVRIGCLLDGTYTGSEYMLQPSLQGAPAGLSGTGSTWPPGDGQTPGTPIIVRALNDGAVLIDGERQRSPISLPSGFSWWVLEGFNAARSSSNVISIRSSRTIIRRVIAWDAWIGGDPFGAGNVYVFGVHGGQGVLLEDVAAFGTARSIMSPSQSGNSSVIVRRAWFRWEGSNYTSFITSKFRYNNNNPLWENVLLTWDELSMPGGAAPSAPQTHIATEGWTGNKCSGGDATTPGQRLYGSILYATATQKISYPNALRFAGAGSSGAESQDTGCVDVKDLVVAIHPSNPRFASTRGLFLSSLGTCCNVDGTPGNPTGPNQFYAQPFKGRFRNITTIAGNGNSIGTAQWDIDLARDLAHSTSLAGAPSPWTNSGARGANACHRYVNGARTATPLWPWPMEDRIKVATAAAGAACSTCQARTQTSVMAHVEGLFGAIPAECRMDVTGPPTTADFVEYNLAEAASGTPTTIQDSGSGTAVNLTALLGTSPSQPQYVEVATGRGLEWTAKGAGGGAHAAITGTKVASISQRATLVVGADVDDASGGPTEEGQWSLALAPVGNTGMSCIVNGQGLIWTGYDLPALGRAFWHCVVDTTQASATNRVRLYRNKVDQGAPTTGTPPAQNATINLSGGRLYLGNIGLEDGEGVSSIDGTTFYSALHPRAFTASEVEADYDVLVLDDDGGGTPPGDPLPGSVLYLEPGVWSATSDVTVTTLTPGLPPNLVPTDDVLAIVTSRTTGTAPTWTFPTLPAGQTWEKVDACHKTGVGGSIALELWKKNGDAPTSSPAIQISDVGFGWTALLFGYRNATGVVQGVDSSSDPATDWTPTGLTTVDDNTRVGIVVASPDENQLNVKTANGFTARLTGSAWDTSRGPQAIGLADTTQGTAGAVTMPVLTQELNGPDVWCGIAYALGLIQTPQPPPPPQGGGPVGVQRFIISDALRPMVNDAIRPMVPSGLR